MRGIALVAIVFGLVTLFSGGSVLFGTGNAREMAGAYVPFVVMFNFIAGFIYILAGAGIWQGRAWAFKLSILIAVATAAAALIFGALILQGSAFEVRTVGALAVRTGFWTVIALFLHGRTGRL
ncbi:hypothetical protein OS189_15540 [Sulfitobacter sp. F26169L]|uniref:hypothetical protein n=1 Tax=Sulfitobacter sp. F26169L TaxID=2996015 RepID=UPI002260AC06|nr:hypothetical protein [Sulfitobacter sp. F26169L]MCX7567757.1 hypothetical protein [Sulfitobacter sp. F26169L]